MNSEKALIVSVGNNSLSLIRKTFDLANSIYFLHACSVTDTFGLLTQLLNVGIHVNFQFYLNQ